MKRAAFYMRVSDDKQLLKFGPAVQRENARAYAARHGLQIVQTYEDAITGKAARRDALDKLLSDAVQYDVAIVSSVDRLARRVQVAYGVLAELMDTGLEVHSTDMGLIDLEDEASNVQFGIRTLFADVDHRKIARRMHEARIRKVAMGTPERPLNGYGWRHGEPDEREQHWVRWMFEQAATLGRYGIAEELNALGVRTRAGRPWSPSSVDALLSNPMYRGEYQFGRSRGTVRATCACPAIVTPDVWARANARKGRTRTSRLDTFPLTGRLTCGECGSAVSGTTMKHGRYAYYVCNSVFIAKSIRKPCDNTRRIPADAAHTAVLGALQEYLTNDEAFLRSLRTPAPEPVDTAAMAADVTRRLVRLDAAYEAGAYPPDEYAGKRRALLAERDALATIPFTPAPTVNLQQARAALAQALTLPSLADTAAAVHLRGTLLPGSHFQLTLDV